MIVLFHLEMVQQVVPQVLLAEHPGVADNDHGVPVNGCHDFYHDYTKVKNYLALVSATLSRLGSAKNPMPWFSLDRTQEMMMMSFSRP